MQKAGRRIDPKLYYYDNDNKIEITHDDIDSIKLYFNAVLSGSTMLGLTVTSKVKLPNKAIYFQNTVSFNDTTATNTYGPFYLKEEPELNADSKTYEYIMYDGFLNAMTDYQPIMINYPCTVLEFLKQLCTECGYTTNITSLPNGSRIIKKDIYADINFTYRDVFDDIGQATATLFRCNNNQVEKCSLGTSTITVDDDLLKNQNISLGEHFGPINSVVLSRSSESDNIYKRDETLTSWNEYKIVDNQLMNDNDRSDYLDELYDALYGIEYDIFDLELVGYGGFNPLDKIEIVTNNTSYHSYVLNNEIEFSQGVAECIYTEMPEESTTDYKAASTTDKKINQTWIIANKNTQQIEQVIQTQTSQSEMINSIQDGLDDLVDQIDSSIIYYKGDYIPTLANEPASTWTTDQLKEDHLGDLFYNTETGSAYRFIKDGVIYTWQEEPDLSEALEMAEDAINKATNAETIANSKRRVFVTEPTVPYDIGDLWTDGEDLFVCKTAKTIEASFSIEDWENTTNYAEQINTTNVKLNETISNLDGTTSTVANLQTTLTNEYLNAEQIESITNGQAQDIEALSGKITQVETQAGSIDLRVTEIENNGVSKVSTVTGTFDLNGLKISKLGEAMSSVLDWDGLVVKRDQEEVLTVRSAGVESENLKVRKWLTLEPARVEQIHAVSDSSENGVGFFV